MPKELLLLSALAVSVVVSLSLRVANADDDALRGDFRWKSTAPLVLPQDIGGISCYSIKDPSIVRFNDRWHLFCTIRGKERSHAVVYLSFADWEEAGKAQRHLLSMHEGYYCAPQVFFFAPQQRWYMICQAASEDWEPNYQPAFATSDDIADPDAWSKLQPLYDPKPENIRAWLDFWVICDEQKAHLFYTSLDGKMWRSETALKNFPRGWTKPSVAIEGDVFEASHTYRLKDRQQFLTVIEAQGGHGWRYQKAYLAERLEGPWKPLAATKDESFASMRNVEHPDPRWTDSISHGELLRDGYDERLVVDPQQLRFVYQGVLDRDRGGKPYGQIPWRLGILEAKAAPQNDK